MLGLGLGLGSRESQHGSDEALPLSPAEVRWEDGRVLGRIKLLEVWMPISFLFFPVDESPWVNLPSPIYLKAFSRVMP